MKKILYIHGANSTARSFAYLKSKLSPHREYFFEYDTHVPAEINLGLGQAMVNAVEPDAIIGHSLGGVFTAYMETDAKKVSIASPFGGSAIANWLPMYSQLMRDVATTSPLIRGLQYITHREDQFLAIVANGLDGRGFDGVVSATSQRRLKGVTFKQYDLNHFEVLVDDEIIEAIDKWI